MKKEPLMNKFRNNYKGFTLNRKRSGFTGSGQALTELAIFGSVLIFVMGAFIQFGMMANYKQNLDRKTMRKAVLLAHKDVEFGLLDDSLDSDNPWDIVERNTGSIGNRSYARQTMNLSAMEDKPVIDPSDPFGIPKRATVTSSANVVVGSEVLSRLGAGAGQDVLKRVYYEINNRPYSFTIEGFKELSGQLLPDTFRFKLIEGLGDSFRDENNVPWILDEKPLGLLIINGTKYNSRSGFPPENWPVDDTYRNIDIDGDDKLEQVLDVEAILVPPRRPIEENASLPDRQDLNLSAKQFYVLVEVWENDVSLGNFIYIYQITFLKLLSPEGGQIRQDKSGWQDITVSENQSISTVDGVELKTKQEVDGTITNTISYPYGTAKQDMVKALPVYVDRDLGDEVRKWQSYFGGSAEFDNVEIKLYRWLNGLENQAIEIENRDFQAEPPRVDDREEENRDVLIIRDSFYGDIRGNAKETWTTQP